MNEILTIRRFRGVVSRRNTQFAATSGTLSSPRGSTIPFQDPLWADGGREVAPPEKGVAVGLVAVVQAIVVVVANEVLGDALAVVALEFGAAASLALRVDVDGIARRRALLECYVVQTHGAGVVFGSNGFEAHLEVLQGAEWSLGV